MQYYPSDVKKLIISTSEFAEQEHGGQSFEIDQLFAAASPFFDQVLLVHPDELEFLFASHVSGAQVFLGDQAVHDADALIVRSTLGCEESTRLLALSLYSRGCELLDPVERFNGSIAGKSTMTLKGMRDKSLPDTFIAFYPEQAQHMISRLIDQSVYPLVGKPTVGSRGEYVAFLTDAKAAHDYATQFFRKFPGISSGIIFQKYIDIAREFRVIVLDGKVLGMVEKSASQNGFGRNAALGSTFMPCHEEPIADFTQAHVSSKGLLGVDTALDQNGRIFVIESNRSPQWKAFEEATGAQVALHIMKSLEKRLSVSSELF